MLNVRIKVDIRNALKGMNELAAKHIPFATARALTWTAQDAQKAVQRELPHQFTLRNNFLKNSVGITAATKTNWTSMVGFKTSAGRNTDFMELQEDGGLKTPRGRVIAVPTFYTRPNKRDIIRKHQRPKELMKKKHVFLGVPKGTGRPLGIYARSKGKLSMMYLLVPVANIKQRLGMEKTVDRVVKERFFRVFNLSMDLATK